MKGIITQLFSGVFLILFITQIDDVSCHGGLLEPPMRSIAWRYGFDTPVNYDWMALYCGGLHTFQQNGGKCGVCGDPYQGPYENDRGGSYDTGIIVRHYPIGLREIEVKVELTAHHKGYFRFKLCPNNDKALTSECLDRYPLQIREGRNQGDPYRYFPAENPKLYELHLVLPPEVTCDRCVLQWTYTAGNSAGSGADGRSCLGCGIQETFVNCADISIGGTRDSIPVAPGNGNTSRGRGPAVILPERPDIVNIIRNAPPERSLHEFMRDIGHPQQRQPEVAPLRPTERVHQPTPPTFDQWGFEGDTGLHHPSASRPDFVDPSARDWGSSHVGETFDPIPTRAPIDTRFDAQGHGQFGGDGTGVGRLRLDFSGISNPSIRAALNNHFHPNPSAPMDNIPSPRLPASRDTFRDSLGAPPSIGSFASPIGHVGHQGGATNSRVIAGQGQFSSLLGSLATLINQINLRPRGGPGSRRFQTTGSRLSSSTLTDKHLKGDSQMLGTDIFGNPTRDMFPTASRRSHHPTTHQRSFFTGARHSGIDSHPRHSPHSFHSGSPRFTSHGLVPTSRSHFRSQNRVVGQRREPVTSRARSSRPIPRKIIVHSMDVAQQLLRRYPQLKGRVFLSSQAHSMNKYANTAHRYRQRHW